MRVFEEVDGPVGEGLPLGGIGSDACLLEKLLCWQELLHARFLINCGLTHQLDRRIEKLHDLLAIACTYCLR